MNWDDEGAAIIAAHPLSPSAESVLAQQIIRICSRYKDGQTVYSDGSGIPPERLALTGAELSDREAALPQLSDASHSKRTLIGQLYLRMILARDNSDPAYDAAGFEYGSTCIRVATQAVLLTETMQLQGIMHESWWLIRYVLIWAQHILAYLVVDSRARVTTAESSAAAFMALDVQQTLGFANNSAKCMYDTVEPAIDQSSTMSP